MKSFLIQTAEYKTLLEENRYKFVEMMIIKELEPIFPGVILSKDTIILSKSEHLLIEKIILNSDDLHIYYYVKNQKNDLNFKDEEEFLSYLKYYEWKICKDENN